MARMTSAPRRRSLWRLFAAPLLLLIAAVAWSGFWFFAASEVGVKADAWRAQEAKSGCPISKLFKGNAEITLDAKLV